MPRRALAAPDLADRAISYLAERIAWLEVLLHGLVLRRRGDGAAAESAVRAATLLQRLLRREAGEPNLPIHRLRRRHPLGSFDEQALWLAVAAQLDDHIQELLASAAEDARRGYPSPWAALELFCEGRRERLRALRAFRPGAPLADRALVALHPRDVAPDNLLLHELRPAPYVVGFLQCDAGISPRLAELARRTAPSIGIEDLALAPEDAAAFAHLLPPLRAVGTDAGARWTGNDSYDVQAAVVLLLTGAPGNGRTLAARALAGEAGAGLVEVDAARLAGLPAAEAARAVDALFREVGFSGDWLLFDAAEALLKEAAPEISLTDRTALVAAVRDGIQRTDTVVVLTATSGDDVARPVRDRVLVHHELRPLPREACELAWQLNVPATVVLARDVDVRQLSEVYSLSAGPGRRRGRRPRGDDPLHRPARAAAEPGRRGRRRGAARARGVGRPAAAGARRAGDRHLARGRRGRGGGRRRGPRPRPRGPGGAAVRGARLARGGRSRPGRGVRATGGQPRPRHALAARAGRRAGAPGAPRGRRGQLPRRARVGARVGGGPEPSGETVAPTRSRSWTTTERLPADSVAGRDQDRQVVVWVAGQARGTRS